MVPIRKDYCWKVQYRPLVTCPYIPCWLIEWTRYQNVMFPYSQREMLFSGLIKKNYKFKGKIIIQGNYGNSEWRSVVLVGRFSRDFRFTSRDLAGLAPDSWKHGRRTRTEMGSLPCWHRRENRLFSYCTRHSIHRRCICVFRCAVHQVKTLRHSSRLKQRSLSAGHLCDHVYWGQLNRNLNE